MNLFSFFGILVALLVTVSVKSERFKRAIVGQKWPINNIAYRFDENFTSVIGLATIRLVLWEMQEMLEVDGQKCLEFNEPDQNQEESVILFQNKLNECSGQVGYVENMDRVLNLGNDCLEPNVIMHEVLHLLGFDHEHARYDRDQHVVIHYDNIVSGVDAKNFVLRNNSNKNMSQAVPYDFFSITHYSWNTLANDSEKFTVESKFPSLTNQKKIDFAETLSPLDILQIQRFYKCRETPAPTIRGSVKIRADKQWKVGLRFLSEASAIKDFNMSLAKQYLERTLETCGKTHFWPLKYPLIDNYDEHYARVCVEKRAFDESCQFSIECESGECHKGKCAIMNELKGFRLSDHYAGPLKVATPSKCLSECLMDGQCEAVSFHQLNQTCYLFKGKDFIAHKDPEYVSMGLADESLQKQILCTVQKGYRFVDYYKAIENMTSSLDCFLECAEDTACAATSYSQADGKKCLLFKAGNHKIHKDSRYNTYLSQLQN